MMMILASTTAIAAAATIPIQSMIPNRRAEQGLIVISPIDPADWGDFRRISLAASRRESRGFFDSRSSARLLSFSTASPPWSGWWSDDDLPRVQDVRRVPRDLEPAHQVDRSVNRLGIPAYKSEPPRPRPFRGSRYSMTRGCAGHRGVRIEPGFPDSRGPRSERIGVVCCPRARLQRAEGEGSDNKN